MNTKGNNAQAKLVEQDPNDEPTAELLKRIQKEDELTALCDQLEAQLNTTEADSCHPLEAMLHDALAQHWEKSHEQSCQRKGFMVGKTPNRFCFLFWSALTLLHPYFTAR